MPKTACRSAKTLSSTPRSSVGHGWLFSLWMILIVVLFIIDQVTKWHFAKTMEPGQVDPVFPGFNFVLAYNRGAAFSFLANAGGWQMWLFGGLAIVVLGVVIRLLWRHSHLTLFCTALSFIGAGAAGNLFDRLFRGYVIDFLDFYYQQWHWPAFNVADIAICLGAALLICDELFGLRKR